MTKTLTPPVLRDGAVRLRAVQETDATARLALGRSAEILRGYGVDASEMGPFTQSDAKPWGGGRWHDDNIMGLLAEEWAA